MEIIITATGATFEEVEAQVEARLAAFIHGADVSASLTQVNPATEVSGVEGIYTISRTYSVERNPLPPAPVSATVSAPVADVAVASMDPTVATV